MTLLWIIGSPAVVMMMPLSETLKLSLLLGSLGIWGILLGTVRPRYFWNNGLVADWRWAFGDYGVAILYVIFGLFAIGAAVAVQV